MPIINQIIEFRDVLHQRSSDYIENIAIGQVLLHISLSIIVVMIAAPVVLAVIFSTQSSAQVLDVTYLWPGTNTYENYTTVLFEYDFIQYYINTLFVATAVTVGCVLIGLVTSLVIVFYRVPFRNVMFIFVLLTLLLPTQVRLVPMYDLILFLGWTDTLWAIIIPHIASATAIFLFRQHFKSLPVSIVESAKIDGVGPIEFLYKVLVPMSKGMIAGITAILWIATWNIYLWALIIISTDENQVVQVGLRLLQAASRGGQTPWELVMAGSVLAMLPPLLLLYVLRKPLLETLAVRTE